MFKASLETRHYSFEAYSTTKSGVKAAMRAGLIAHARQRVLMPGQLIRDLWADVEIHEVEMGVCYRDRTKITNL